MAKYFLIGQKEIDFELSIVTCIELWYGKVQQGAREDSQQLVKHEIVRAQQELQLLGEVAKDDLGQINACRLKRNSTPFTLRSVVIVGWCLFECFISPENNQFVVSDRVCMSTLKAFFVRGGVFCLFDLLWHFIAFENENYAIKKT